MAEANDMARLREKLGDKLLETKEFRGETTALVELGALHDTLVFCRDEFGFDMLIDLSSLDFLGEDPRFQVVYELATVDDSKHLRIKAKVGEEESVPSCVDVWAGADWHEREVFDMMGIRFHGHPNMKRLIMWEGYPYHPLRKDFPLTGKPTEMPEVAVTDTAPYEGGPFVSPTGAPNRVVREPRAKGEG
jgi:NADH-quinone oxidoreductase subunit C